MKTKSTQCPRCTGSKDMPLCSDIVHSPKGVQRTNDVPAGAEPSQGAPNAAQFWPEYWKGKSVPLVGDGDAIEFAEAYAKSRHVVLLDALKEMREEISNLESVMELAGLKRETRGWQNVRAEAAEAALHQIDECVNDTTVAWEARLYQIKRYTQKAIKEAQCREK